MTASCDLKRAPNIYDGAMQSKAANVADYIKEAPADRQPVLRKLRKTYQQALPGYEERIEYGMPAYARNGKMEAAFASQKQYISVYVGKEDVVSEFREQLKGASIGKGCIRFTKPERIDFDVVERLLRRTAESNSAAC